MFCEKEWGVVGEEKRKSQERKEMQKKQAEVFLHVITFGLGCFVKVLGIQYR